MRVKICGMRNNDDIDIAVAAGCDAVGFLVGLTHFSEDRLDPLEARLLIRMVPPFVQPVLVTHLVDPRDITDLAVFLGVSAIQLHGEMDVTSVAAVRHLQPMATIIRAVHVTDGIAVQTLVSGVSTLASSVDAVLLDSRTKERLGGTGLTHDWSVSRQVVSGSPKPVILAGGLTPANVAQAVHEVHPYAVDVNSGVENARGDKSADLCTAFVASALSAE